MRSQLRTRLLLLAAAAALLAACANRSSTAAPATSSVAATASSTRLAETAPPAALTLTPPPAATALQLTALPAPTEALTGTGQVARTALTLAELMEGPGSGLVDDSAFALPDGAAPPTNVFEGQLRLKGARLNGGSEVLRDDFGLGVFDWQSQFPAVTLSFVQSGSALIPAQQGLLYTGHIFWNIIVGPSRVWDEAGDSGFTRASVPIALIERNLNCVHNATLMFLFNAAEVSRVQYQISQETCLYLKFNAWGQLSAAYTPGAIAGAEELKAAHAREVAGRLPTRPVEALATDYPASKVKPDNLLNGLKAEDVTAYGLLYGGINYLGPCQTRTGAYAFCESMRLPSYSVAKSAFAAVALMRLGQKYDVGVYDLLIRDYVPAAAQAPGGWAGVTFAHALDMATGYYQSAGDEADELDPQFNYDFIVPEAYADKLAAAFAYPYREPPGRTWVYHTSDTFILTQAMNAYLKSQAGAEADIFNLVRDEVYIPSGLSAGALTSLRTGNSPTGAPMGGYGLFLTLDDTAKIARLLNNDQGRIAGQQVLEPSLLAAALQQNSADRGLDTTGSTPFKYNNGFWAQPVSAACETWVPYMGGFGGIVVALMPNGVNYFYFSDNNQFSWHGAVAQSQRLARFCP